MSQPERKSFGEKLQSIPKPYLFFILILCTSIPLWFPGIKVPNKPQDSTVDLFNKLMELPEGSTVLVSSDWTNSTRGESGGQFKALFRILMRKHIRACIYTSADPQAPKVARDTLQTLNEIQTAAHRPTYDEWKDWVHLGYFPNAEGTALSIAANLKKAFSGKKAKDPGTGNMRDVFESPVLDKVQKVADFPLLIVLTASNTSTITIERLNGKVPLAMLVTGVMGPETQVYYQSGQVIGLSKGLKGVYDLETMMDEKFPGELNLDQGSLYYPTLHIALILLILAVAAGNVGMFLGRRRATQS